jgi:hypothetical protein
MAQAYRAGVFVPEVVDARRGGAHDRAIGETVPVSAAEASSGGFSAREGGVTLLPQAWEGAESLRRCGNVNPDGALAESR